MVQAPPAPPFRPHSELDPLVLPRLGAQALEGDGQLRARGQSNTAPFVVPSLPPSSSPGTVHSSELRQPPPSRSLHLSAFVTVPASGFSSVK